MRGTPTSTRIPRTFDHMVQGALSRVYDVQMQLILACQTGKEVMWLYRGRLSFQIAGSVSGFFKKGDQTTIIDGLTTQPYWIWLIREPSRKWTMLLGSIHIQNLAHAMFHVGRGSVRQRKPFDDVKSYTEWKCAVESVIVIAAVQSVVASRTLKSAGSILSSMKRGLNTPSEM